jgi:hypothetical protein
MEWVVTVLSIAVVCLVIALWRMDQRVATLEGKTGNALERARDAWFRSLSPLGKTIFVHAVLCVMALGVTLVFGLIGALVPFLLYLGNKMAFKWPVIFFFGSMGLYIAVVTGYYAYCPFVRGVEPEP